MIKLSVILVALMLSGCGSYGAISSCKSGSECTAYALITEGKVSGIAATVGGQTNTCKVSVFGNVNAWRVMYNGSNCVAELNGEGLKK
jgi:uncharacterized protein YceK